MRTRTRTFPTHTQGDNSIRLLECVDSDPYMYVLDPFQSSEMQLGAVFLPKTALDIPYVFNVLYSPLLAHRSVLAGEGGKCHLPHGAPLAHVLLCVYRKGEMCASPFMVARALLLLSHPCACRGRGKNCGGGGGLDYVRLFRVRSRSLHSLRLPQSSLDRLVPTPPACSRWQTSMHAQTGLPSSPNYHLYPTNAGMWRLRARCG